MKKLCLLLCGATWFPSITQAYDESEVLTCCKTPTVIVFTNGVWNTTDDAFDGLQQLKNKTLRNTAIETHHAPVEFDLAYNLHEGKLLDVLQVIDQFEQDLWLPFVTGYQNLWLHRLRLRRPFVSL